MFHLKFPGTPDFFNWSELRSLARALGYTMDIFENNITEEISTSPEGVSFKEMIKMLDYNILQTVLHQTINMHTADWNMCVIRKSLHLLNHKALSFEEIHMIRVGYEMYESTDMKGIKINQYILLRALKMCSRMIAPMKLMHRIKHMKDDFDEKGRIQLYEFLDLILWCDLYDYFKPDLCQLSPEKERDLFQLVDFERLLSHHDEKLSALLDRKYLEEEWEFEKERLGKKHNFKDPTVLTEDAHRRIQYYRDDYKPLKRVINESESKIYQAKAGYIRPRPLTAPQLSHYHQKASKQMMTETSVSEAYKMVQKRLRSAPPRSSRILPERPKTSQYHRQTTPPVVTPLELQQFQDKLGSLHFAITTVKTRVEEDLHDDMDFLLPGYRENKSKQVIPEVKVEVEKPVRKPENKKKIMESKAEELAHPHPRNSSLHFKRCDARYRGWHNVSHKKGIHKILIDPSFNEGQNGHFLKQLNHGCESAKNYIYRYTVKKNFVPKKGKPRYRPQTTPASSRLSGNFDSCVGSNSSSRNLFSPDSENSKMADQHQQQHKGISKTEKTVVRTEDKNNLFLKKTIGERDNSKEFEPIEKKTIHEKTTTNCFTKPKVKEIDYSSYPCPVMKHTKPKIVEVGHIGKIKLLERIEESQDLEELLEEPLINTAEVKIIEAEAKIQEADLKINVTEGTDHETKNHSKDSHDNMIVVELDSEDDKEKEEKKNEEQVLLMRKCEKKVSKNNICEIQTMSTDDECLKIGNKNNTEDINLETVCSEPKSEKEQSDDQKTEDSISSCHRSLTPLTRSNTTNRAQRYLRLANRIKDSNFSYTHSQLLKACSS